MEEILHEGEEYTELENNTPVDDFEFTGRNVYDNRFNERSSVDPFLDLILFLLVISVIGMIISATVALL